MITGHSATTEKIGAGLVSSVETFKGRRLEFTKRLAGFNGISTSRDGDVRKVEIKTMGSSDNWIAINGLKAIDKLFFDPEYWLYFVLIPENIVVMAKALPFLKAQIAISDGDVFQDDLRGWIKNTRALSRKSGLKIFPRVHAKFKVPLRRIIEGGDFSRWRGAIAEVWQNTGGWTSLYVNEPDE
jgi:hypothetical protein